MLIPPQKPLHHLLEHWQAVSLVRRHIQGLFVCAVPVTQEAMPGQIPSGGVPFADEALHHCY